MIVSFSINPILYFKLTFLIVRISSSSSDRPFIVGRTEDKFILLLSRNILSMAIFQLF